MQSLARFPEVRVLILEACSLPQGGVRGLGHARTALGSRRGGISRAPAFLDSSSIASARGGARRDTSPTPRLRAPSTQQEDRSPSNIQRTADAHRKLKGPRGRNGVEGGGA